MPSVGQKDVSAGGKAGSIRDPDGTSVFTGDKVEAWQTWGRCVVSESWGKVSLLLASIFAGK